MRRRCHHYGTERFYVKMLSQSWCRITSVKISPLVDDRRSSDRTFVDLCGVAILSHGVLYACADEVISDL